MLGKKPCKSPTRQQPGVLGFTIAVGSLWDTFPPGAIRFIHGGIVIVAVTTIGFLLVQHFHRNQGARNQRAGAPSGSGQPAA